MMLRFGRLSTFSTFFFVVMLMITGSAGCQSIHGGVVAKQDKKDPSIWTLSNGQVDVVVNASIGRITRYGFAGGENALWVNTDPRNEAFIMGGWTNYGGDKVWPWPQSLFGWPPPEPKEGYTVEAVDQKRALRMTSPTLKGFGVRIVRKIELSENAPTMMVTSWLEPTGEPMTKRIGAWSITQVPTPKEVYVRVPLAGDRKRLLERAAADGFAAKLAAGDVVRLTADPDKGGKTFFDGDVIAAVLDKVVLVQQQLAAHEQGVWATDERAQIYGHPVHAKSVPAGPSYYELEWTAPAVQAAIAPEAPLKVKYELVKLDAKMTSDAIAQMVQKLPSK